MRVRDSMSSQRTFSRRGFLRRSAAAAAGLTLAYGGCTRLRRVRNVVLITIDTLRADHVGCYGYPRPVSPFIDTLAEQGILFRNAIAASSHTNPSHASIFTSLYPVQHRLHTNAHMRLDRSIYTMAHMFADAGYETAAFCSVHFLVSLKGGFAAFDTTANRDWKSYRRANRTIDSALSWLRERTPADKLFLWVHLYDPHNPYYTTGKCFTEIEVGSQAEQDDLVRYWTEVQGVPMDFWKTEQRLVQRFNNYDAEIRFVDKEIKRLYEFFEQEGLNSDALWVITSDHGEGLGNHGYAGHGKHIYNEQLHVPLLFCFTNRTYAGMQLDGLVRHVDILPTLADIIDASLDKQPLSIQGGSLVPVMSRAERGPSAQYAFAQRRPPELAENTRSPWEPGEIYSLQNLKFKYIYHSEGEDEFYNLESDRLEMDNLMGDPSPIKDEMKKTVTAMYDTLLCESKGVTAGGIDKSRLEELKALGYVK